MCLINSFENKTGTLYRFRDGLIYSFWWLGWGTSHLTISQLSPILRFLSVTTISYGRVQNFYRKSKILEIRKSESVILSSNKKRRYVKKAFAWNKIVKKFLIFDDFKDFFGKFNLHNLPNIWLLFMCWWYSCLKGGPVRFKKFQN